MKKITSKEELEAALKAGETELIVEDKKLLNAIILASKYKSSKEIFREWWIRKILRFGSCSVGVAITPTVVIVVTITFAITAIAIVAMLKNYQMDVEIEYDSKTEIPTGKIKLHPQA